jgi:putative hemolysin
MISILGVAACKNDATKPDTPNPASKHCIETGGKLRIITSPDGSAYGLCTLPNGVGCDEWAYFRGECPKPCPHQSDPAQCPMYSPPSPNYCKGGNTFTVKDSCGCTSHPICDMTPGN